MARRMVPPRSISRRCGGSAGTARPAQG
jgi:hypothetical protein